MPSHRNPASPRGFFISARAFALGTGALLLLAGCHRVVTDPQDPRFIVAEKPKGWSMTRAQLDQEIDTILRQGHQTRQQVGPAKMPIVEGKVLHSMVLKKLLLDRAAEMHLDDADEIKAEGVMMDKVKGNFPTQQEFDQKLAAAGISPDEFKKQIHEQVLILRTLQADALHQVDPTEQEIDDFYLKNKEKMVIPEKVRASRVVIMVDDRTSPADKAARKKAIDAAHARVVKGEDFAKVASEVSEDRYSAPKGGDVGYFQRGENEDNFDAVAFSTKPGVVSPVFQTPMGYQFLKVTDVQEGGEISVAQARSVITNYLRQQNEAQQEDAYTRNLLAGSGVIFHLMQVDPASPANTAPPAATPAPAADGTK